MTPEKWAIVKGVFAAARRAPLRDRAAIVESLCDGDREVSEQAHELLRHENDLPELDTPSRLLGLPKTDGERGTDGGVPALPERVGSYVVLRLVGAGRFGAVYEAIQAKTRRPVALKVLRLGRTGARALQRFEFEATALARLSHPGIAQIYEAGVDTNTGEARPFLAMEMVGGVEITSYTKRERLDLRARARLLIAVCEAAQHAHERGIVHLDLKPANIVVSSEGQPKIVDFGVAMVSDAPEAGNGKPAERGGTIPYMSPEQLAGQIDEIDLRSDVYALGVLLYELVEGGLPREIQGQSFVEAILRARAGSGFGFARGKGGMDCLDLEAIVRRATAGDREARYPSALEMSMDLRRFAEDRPVAARGATAWYVARKFAKRRKGVTAAILAGVVGVVGVVAWSAWARREAQVDAGIARELVTRVLNEEVARIADTQGTQEARRSWLGHVRPGVMELLGRHPDDPGIALAAARLLVLESDVEHESAEIDASLRHRLDALALRSGPTLARLTDERALMDLSINHVKVGDIYLDREKWAIGRNHYERALKIDEQLAARPNASLEARDNLAWSYDRMRRFSTTEAERRSLCEKQYKLADGLVKSDPGRALSWLNRANAGLTHADLCVKPEAKPAVLRQALADARRAASINAESRTIYRMVLTALRRVMESEVGDRPTPETRELVQELKAMADAFRPSERLDMLLSGAALQARLACAETHLRWEEREEALEQKKLVGLALADYTTALANRRDESGVRDRFERLEAAMSKR